MKKKILVVDDEEGIRFSFSELLKMEGFLVETSATLAECREQMEREFFDLMILDVGLGGDNSIAAIQEIRQNQPGCGIVVITGNPQVKGLLAARKQGAIDYLVKPVHRESLLYNVKKCLAAQEKLNRLIQ